jgi:hypothetical protein
MKLAPLLLVLAVSSPAAEPAYYLGRISLAPLCARVAAKPGTVKIRFAGMTALDDAYAVSKGDRLLFDASPGAVVDSSSPASVLRSWIGAKKSGFDKAAVSKLKGAVRSYACGRTLERGSVRRVDPKDPGKPPLAVAGNAATASLSGDDGVPASCRPAEIDDLKTDDYSAMGFTVSCDPGS